MVKLLSVMVMVCFMGTMGWCGPIFLADYSNGVIVIDDVDSVPNYTVAPVRVLDVTRTGNPHDVCGLANANLAVLAVNQNQQYLVRTTTPPFSGLFQSWQTTGLDYPNTLDQLGFVGWVAAGHGGFYLDRSLARIEPVTMTISLADRHFWDVTSTANNDILACETVYGDSDPMGVVTAWLAPDYVNSITNTVPLSMNSYGMRLAGLTDGGFAALPDGYEQQKIYVFDSIHDSAPYILDASPAFADLQLKDLTGLDDGRLAVLASRYDPTHAYQNYLLVYNLTDPSTPEKAVLLPDLLHPYAIGAAAFRVDPPSDTPTPEPTSTPTPDPDCLEMMFTVCIEPKEFFFEQPITGQTEFCRCIEVSNQTGAPLNKVHVEVLVDSDNPDCDYCWWPDLEFSACSVQKEYTDDGIWLMFWPPLQHGESCQVTVCASFGQCETECMTALGFRVMTECGPAPTPTPEPTDTPTSIPDCMELMFTACLDVEPTDLLFEEPIVGQTQFCRCIEISNQTGAPLNRVHIEVLMPPDMPNCEFCWWLSFESSSCETQTDNSDNGLWVMFWPPLPHGESCQITVCASFGQCATDCMAAIGFRVMPECGQAPTPTPEPTNTPTSIPDCMELMFTACLDVEPTDLLFAEPIVGQMQFCRCIEISNQTGAPLNRVHIEVLMPPDLPDCEFCWWLSFESSSCLIQTDNSDNGLWLMFWPPLPHGESCQVTVCASFGQCETDCMAALGFRVMPECGQAPTPTVEPTNTPTPDPDCMELMFSSCVGVPPMELLFADPIVGQTQFCRCIEISNQTGMPMNRVSIEVIMPPDLPNCEGCWSLTLQSSTCVTQTGSLQDGLSVYFWPPLEDGESCQLQLCASFEQCETDCMAALGFRVMPFCAQAPTPTVEPVATETPTNTIPPPDPTATTTATPVPTATNTPTCIVIDVVGECGAQEEITVRFPEPIQMDQVCLCVEVRNNTFYRWSQAIVTYIVESECEHCWSLELKNSSCSNTTGYSTQNQLLVHFNPFLGRGQVCRFDICAQYQRCGLPCTPKVLGVKLQPMCVFPTPTQTVTPVPTRTTPPTRTFTPTRTPTPVATYTRAPTSTPVALDLFISGIEVVQVVQNQDRNVPLVADKPTVVRAYISLAPTMASYTGNITGRLFYYRNGVLRGEVYPMNGGILSQTTAVQNPDRGNFWHSLNFRLPADAIAAGQTQFVVEVNPRFVIGAGGPFAIAMRWITENNYNNNRYPTAGRHSVSFHRRTNRFRIGYYAINYDPNNNGTGTLPTNNIHQGDDMFRRIFPIAPQNVEYRYLGQMSFTKTLDGWQNYKDLIAQLNTAWALSAIMSHLWGVDAFYDQIHGWLPSGAFWGNGCSDPVWLGSVGRVGFTNESRTPATNDRWRRTFAHEIGHNFNQYHPSDDRNDPARRLAAGQEYGFDVVNREVKYQYTSIETGSVLQYFDIMEPAKREWEAWVTPYMYRAFYDWDFVQPRGYQDFLRRGAQVEALAVSGVISVTNEATLFPAYRVTSGVMPSAATGEYAIVLLDNTAQELYRHQFDVEFNNADFDGGSDTEMEPGQLYASLFQVIPFPQGTAAVVLQHNELELDRLLVSAHVPEVTVEVPIGGQIYDQDLPIQWVGTDADPEDEDRLRYSVFYSADNKQNWQALGTNISDNNLLVDVAHIPGGTQSYVRVIVTDGVNTSQADSGLFSVPGKPPMALIDEPLNGAHYGAYELVVMNGRAMDMEEPDLDDDALVWSSSVDGVLGTGAHVETIALTPGEHLITLTATNSELQSASSSVVIVVEDNFRLLGDVYRDGKIDHLDMMHLVKSWNCVEGQPGYNPAADLNNDGIVDEHDVLLLMQAMLLQ